MTVDGNIITQELTDTQRLEWIINKINSGTLEFSKWKLEGLLEDIIELKFTSKNYGNTANYKTATNSFRTLLDTAILDKGFIE